MKPAHRKTEPLRSLPSRGAWIEIFLRPGSLPWAWSLPSRGAWIEILGGLIPGAVVPSLPSRGAWIEIPELYVQPANAAVAPLAGSVDRNLFARILPLAARWSLPSRGAWIEIRACMALSSACLGRSPRGERG